MKYQCAKNIMNRLRRIEGQVKGIIRMADEGRACEDMLLQIKAAQSGLKKVASILVTEHIDHCIQEAIKEGKGEEAVERLKQTIHQSMKI